MQDERQKAKSERDEIFSPFALCLLPFALKTHRTIKNIYLMPKKKTTTLFEDSLAELEQLVNHLEQGDVSLEESLKSFERGVNLTRICQKALQEAEQKVQILIEKNGTQILEPFTDE
jgi:exodeoxyribonuclease VII small subunit